MSITLTDEQAAALRALLGEPAQAPAPKRARKAKANTFYANVIAARVQCPRCKRTFTPNSSGVAHHARPVKPGSKRLSRTICE